MFVMCVILATRCSPVRVVQRPGSFGSAPRNQRVGARAIMLLKLDGCAVPHKGGLSLACLAQSFGLEGRRSSSFAPVGAAFILGVAEQGERGGAHEPRQVFTGNLPPIGQGHPGHPGHRNDRWEVPEFEYLCTQKLAKTHYPTAESYMLDRLTEDFGLPAFQHHDTGQDAAAAAHRVLPLAREMELTDPDALWPPVTKRTFSLPYNPTWRKAE